MSCQKVTSERGKTLIIVNGFTFCRKKVVKLFGPVARKCAMLKFSQLVKNI
jgi:hypothetical protein